VYTWPSGKKYEGQYESALKHGQGVLTWPDGKTYTGHFKQDNRHG